MVVREPTYKKGGWTSRVKLSNFFSALGLVFLFAGAEKGEKDVLILLGQFLFRGGGLRRQNHKKNRGGNQTKSPPKEYAPETPLGFRKKTR